MAAAGTGRARPRIAIVGANFAGLAAAQGLGRRYAVTVIDRSPWFEWKPNIHELVSRVKRPRDLRLRRARLVARAGHRFVRAEVEGIDAAAGRIFTATGRGIDFDVCVVAVGGVNETFGVRGAARHAMPFKDVDDCQAIGRRLAALAQGREARSVVVVGGGLEGVEALGEILRRYRTRDGLRVHLVEAARRVLPEAPPALDAAVRAHCEHLDVSFHTGSRVTAVTPRRVRLDSGKLLRSDLTIWTGGVTAPRLLVDSGLSDEPNRWAPVTKDLRSRKFDNVFVIGDAAEWPRPIAKQAYYALQMGACAAGNVARAIAGRALVDFRPSPKPMLVAFGDMDTYLVSGRTVVASPALAAAKEAVFQFTMAQVDPPLGGEPLQALARRLQGAAAGKGLPLLESRAARAGLRRLALLDGRRPPGRR